MRNFKLKILVGIVLLSSVLIGASSELLATSCPPCYSGTWPSCTYDCTSGQECCGGTCITACTGCDECSGGSCVSCPAAGETCCGGSCCEDCCNDVCYDPAIDECCGGVVITKCDSSDCNKSCDAASQSCQPNCGSGEDCCDDGSCYNTSTEECCGGVVITKCLDCQICNSTTSSCEDDDSQDPDGWTDGDCGYCKKCSYGNCVISSTCSSTDCGECDTDDGSCDPISSCYHIENDEWIEGDCNCSWSSFSCEDPETHYSVPQAESGGPGQCRQRIKLMDVGVEYPCEEGTPSYSGALQCAVALAAEFGSCAVQCGSGLANCLAFLLGAGGDPASCSNDFPSCMDCLEGLDFDCGCVLPDCENGSPSAPIEDYGYELYDGSCS